MKLRVSVLRALFRTHFSVNNNIIIIIIIIPVFRYNKKFLYSKQILVLTKKFLTSSLIIFTRFSIYYKKKNRKKTKTN
jgi:hypothetical protein